MRLGDLDALKEIFLQDRCGNIFLPKHFVISTIDNAPTVDLTKNQAYDKGFIAAMKAYSRPQGEWIPIKYRPLTVDERISLAEHCGVEYSDTLDEKAFDCPMPEDGQRILLSRSWGVDIDVADNDIDGEGFICYGLEGNGDWDGVIAWQPLPKPYKDPLDHSFEDIRCKAEKCSPEGCKHCEGYEPIEFGGDKE